MSSKFPAWKFNRLLPAQPNGEFINLSLTADLKRLNNVHPDVSTSHHIMRWLYFSRVGLKWRAQAASKTYLGMQVHKLCQQHIARRHRGPDQETWSRQTVLSVHKISLAGGRTLDGGIQKERRAHFFECCSASNDIPVVYCRQTNRYPPEVKGQAPDVAGIDVHSPALQRGGFTLHTRNSVWFDWRFCRKSNRKSVLSAKPQI